jgi:hypothetical protein
MKIAIAIAIAMRRRPFGTREVFVALATALAVSMAAAPVVVAEIRVFSGGAGAPQSVLRSLYICAFDFLPGAAGGT